MSREYKNLSFFRDNEIQLSSTRSTRYQPLKLSKQHLVSPRQALSFRNLYESDYKPYYGELDVVGLVVHLEEGPGSFETVYLSNEESIIIGICFWGGLKVNIYKFINIYYKMYFKYLRCKFKFI